MSDDKITDFPPKIRAYILASNAVKYINIPASCVKNKDDREAIQKELNAIGDRLFKSAKTINRNDQIKEIWGRDKK